jgi:hypothetical protein
MIASHIFLADRLSRFLGKILPEGWRFYPKPAGLDLESRERGF